ncbi:MAG: rhodanese-like domain-containing protein [Bdellovibrionaceae bacterium]|nr:rhodanese-like domain-containing protein [Pseudobdellovibrionaceae bacterium]
MFKISSFYKFFPIKKENLKQKKSNITKSCKDLKIKGLVLISEEGLNATFCGKEKEIENLKTKLTFLFNQDFFWKDSYSSLPAFKRLSVKIKKEIINIGIEQNHLTPFKNNGQLSPQKWQYKLKQKVQILDVRNNYEVALGRFEGAKYLDMDTFQEFSKKLDQLKIDKEKETLLYCTGGIRCEKAIELMKEKGFQKLYQLEGGILNYLKEFPNSHFKEECFVFDHRVSVNQNLEMGKKYSLCPHCGQPGKLAISCKHCDKPTVICKICQKKAIHYETCSKNCAYHFKKGHICRKKYKKTEKTSESKSSLAP